MKGIISLSEAISADMRTRLPHQRKTQRDKLSLLVATMIVARSGNTMKLGEYLPHSSNNRMSRFQWIKRFLSNPLVNPVEVMAPYGREILQQLGRNDQQVVIIIDQTQAGVVHRHEMLMIGVQACNRALPLLWRVKKTAGPIGFKDQEALLRRVRDWLPESARVVLMGDRFYGTPALISLCRSFGWDWRLRLKDNFLVFDAGAETSLADCVARGEHMLTDVELTGQRVKTPIAIVHDPGHAEPWIIASSRKPSRIVALDYGLPLLGM